MSKPLEGLLVVAVEQAVAAPLCTARLAQAGARVIKVERAEGDFARGYDTAAKGSSSYFVWCNQGKESIVLDFKKACDAALLERLISRADVFVQNLAPDALARSGFGSKRLRSDYSSLITLNISGYGDGAEVAHLKAYDFLIQAEAGLTAISGGEAEMGRIGVSLCDIGAGVTAHAAVLEALIKRGITGHGSALSVSLFDVAAEWMSVPMLHDQYGNGAPKRVGLRHPSIAPYGAFETSEGDLTLVSIQNEREWQVFCADVLGIPEAVMDPRFASNTQRVANRDALEVMITSMTNRLTQKDFRDRLAFKNIAFGGVNSVEQVRDHPALRGRCVHTETGDTVIVPAPPIRWLDAPEPNDLAPAPSLGQHSALIRTEFSKDAI